MECSVYGCIKRVRANGLCNFHYEQDRAAKAPKCSFEGCEAPSITKGLCTVHYRAELRKDALPCNVPGCGRPVVGKGLCDTHRIRMRSGSTEPSDWGRGSAQHPAYQSWYWLKRHAGQFSIDPHWQDFWAFIADVGERPTPNHRLEIKDRNARREKDNVHWVETRISAKDKNDYQRRWRKNNPRATLNSDMQKNYGISLDEYERIEREQGGVCAICKGLETALNRYTKQPRRLAVDHCHDVGNVRGLLCAQCNTMIGLAKDRIDILEAAIAYLKR